MGRSPPPRSTSATRRVVVVQRILPHYRLAFFERLHDVLARRGIVLEVIYGQHSTGSVPQSVFSDRPWVRFAKNRYLSMWGRELVWQSATDAALGADLVIIEHAARLLGNYPLLARRWLGGPRVAFWGHGANFQAANPDSLWERVKRVLLNCVDWWFAYTQSSVVAVAQAGFPAERITVVHNAIDDTELRAAMQSILPIQIESLRRDLGVEGGHVAVYCGGLYAEKRLDFLLEACIRVRELIPDFEVVFIGSGPEQHVVAAASEQYSWIRYVGPLFGADRARYFAIGQALLMPGLVGLAIVDSFVAGVPLFTTDIPSHSPEIAYLSHGVNGVMSKYDVEEYARAVAECLNASDKMERLRRGCLESASFYTLDNMVRNFADGIEACLAAERR